MGGRFGEMSTLMNYTFQSFNFATRRARGRSSTSSRTSPPRSSANRARRLAINRCSPAPHRGEGKPPGDAMATARSGHQPAPLPRRRPGRAAAGFAREPVDGRLRLLLRRPRRGPDAQLLPRDRGAQQQAQGLRDVRPPGGTSAHGLPARARRRAPGRLRARGRAADRRRPDEDVPVAADPDGQDPRVQAAHRQGRCT